MYKNTGIAALKHTVSTIPDLQNGKKAIFGPGIQIRDGELSERNDFFDPEIANLTLHYPIERHLTTV